MVVFVVVVVVSKQWTQWVLKGQVHGSVINHGIKPSTLVVLA